jgi:dihydroflavonol-4-reductase
LILLSENENAKNKRFIIAGDTISYKKIFDLMAGSFNLKPPSIKVPSSLIFSAWIYAWIESVFTGKEPFITRDMAITSAQEYSYDNSRIKNLLDYNFIPIEKTIADTCSVYLSEITKR